MKIEEIIEVVKKDLNNQMDSLQEVIVVKDKYTRKEFFDLLKKLNCETDSNEFFYPEQITDTTFKMPNIIYISLFNNVKYWGTCTENYIDNFEKRVEVSLF